MTTSLARPPPTVRDQTEAASVIRLKQPSAIAEIRIWQRNGIKPHLARTFKLSRDPRFEDKLLDVVGLYLNPPEHALVLSCDEKSQIQGASSEGWRVQQEIVLPGQESEPRSLGSRKERKR